MLPPQVPCSSVAKRGGARIEVLAFLRRRNGYEGVLGFLLFAPLERKTFGEMAPPVGFNCVLSFSTSDQGVSLSRARVEDTRFYTGVFSKHLETPSSSWGWKQLETRGPKEVGCHS